MTGFRRLCAKFSVVMTALTAFLLPLKFGGISGLPEIPGFYPPEMSDYLIVSWPVQFFPVVSGLALLLAAVSGARRLSGPRDVRLLLWLWGALLPAAALWGSMNTSVMDYSAAICVHYVGIGAWCWCVSLLVAAEPRRAGVFFAALMWGTFCAVLAGWYQYLWGFAETRRYFAEAAAGGAADVSEQLRIKLADDRVYATFSSCNNFAGFLLLSGAALVLYFAGIGERFEPRKFSRILFGVVVLALTLGVLFLTRSRGALLCMVIVALAAFLSGGGSRRSKAAAVVLALLVVAGGAWYVRCAGRGFSSSAERLDYLATTAKIVAAHPLCGAGWDGFHIEHMRSKRTATDEASHDPHNFVSAFAAAGGLPAGAVALAALIFPFVVMYRRMRKFDPLRRAAFWGCVAFALHMMMEIDHLSPAGPAAFILLVVGAVPSGADDAEEPSRLRSKITVAFALILAAAALFPGWSALSGDLAYARFCSVVEPEPGTPWRPPTPQHLESALNEVMSARSFSPFPLEKAAECYAALGDLRRAEELFGQSLKIGGPRPGTLWRLAEVLEIQGRRSEAEACRTRAVRLFPSKYRPLLDRARQSAVPAAPSR